MNKFSEGQKVVFIGVQRPHPQAILPNIDEVVTLKEWVEEYSAWVVDGFELDRDGDPQGIDSIAFRPLEPQHHSKSTIKNLRVLRELASKPITIETLEPQKQEA